MKKLLVVLSLVVASNFVHAAGKAPVTDVLTDPTAVNEVPLTGEALATYWDRTGDLRPKSGLVPDAKKLALDILDYVRKDQRSQVAATMIDGLTKADVLTPKPGNDFAGCERGVLAYVMGRYDGKIRLCAVTVSGRFKTEYVAQVLVHETTHVVGVHDECQSTKIEVAIMRASPIGLVFQNGYWESCGIR